MYYVCVKNTNNWNIVITMIYQEATELEILALPEKKRRLFPDCLANQTRAIRQALGRIFWSFRIDAKQFRASQSVIKIHRDRVHFWCDKVHLSIDRPWMPTKRNSGDIYISPTWCLTKLGKNSVKFLPSCMELAISSWPSESRPYSKFQPLPILYNIYYIVLT